MWKAGKTGKAGMDLFSLHPEPLKRFERSIDGIATPGRFEVGARLEC